MNVIDSKCLLSITEAVKAGVSYDTVKALVAKSLELNELAYKTDIVINQKKLGSMSPEDIETLLKDALPKKEELNEKSEDDCLKCIISRIVKEALDEQLNNKKKRSGAFD